MDPTEPCIRHTGATDLLTGIKVVQIDNICHWVGLFISVMVCNVTYSDSGEELRILTPPWGVLGLGYSLRDEMFNLILGVKYAFLGF